MSKPFTRSMPVILAAGLCLAPASVRAGDTIRVSLASGGAEADGDSQAHTFAGMNAAGSVVAFMSAATNLVPGDSNGQTDVFVRDLKRGTTERVSVATDGTEGDGSSLMGTVSSNGRVIAFMSGASTLVAGDTNGTTDVFVHDRVTKETKRVSVNSAGIQGDLPSGGSGFLAVAGNGRSVAYSSSATNLVAADTNGQEDVFVHDLKSGVTSRVSVGDDESESDGFSAYPAPSTSGQVVAFLSAATNLVPGDANGAPDVFVRDLRKGTTRRVSVGPGGVEADAASGGPAISGNGRMVAFFSAATNLVPGDTNGKVDVFVHDLKTGVTTRASVASDGSEGNGVSAAVAISANGRAVIFTSDSDNLVPADTNGVDDVFVRDLKAGTTVRVNVDGAGVQSTGFVGFDLGLSKNGRLALFSSEASSLVIGDTNGLQDVFLHDLKN